MATEPGSHRLAHWRTSGVDHGDRSPTGRFADTHAQRRCQIVQRRCAGLLIPRVLYIWLHEFILLIQQIKVTAYGASYGAPMITIEDGLIAASHHGCDSNTSINRSFIGYHPPHGIRVDKRCAIRRTGTPIRCVGSRLKV